MAAFWWRIQLLSATLPLKEGRALSDRKYPPLILKIAGSRLHNRFVKVEEEGDMSAGVHGGDFGPDELWEAACSAQPRGSQRDFHAETGRKLASAISSSRKFAPPIRRADWSCPALTSSFHPTFNLQFTAGCYC
jgi:hypothetical protein